MYSQHYFDYNATTPCAKEVVDAMLPYFYDHFGNPSSSSHPYGWLAKSAVEDATRDIAKSLEVSAKDLIYTSGATESINMILKGVCRKYKSKGRHLITTKVEHKAVLDTCAFLEEEGFEITYLEVGTQGHIDLEQLKNALRVDTVLASILYANNETGVIQPMDEIAALAKANGTLLFSDMTQALGKIPVKPVLDQIDFACFSGHKVYGPKGIGLVYAKNNAEGNVLPSFIQGGRQQRGQRGGTINTPCIVGLAKAIALTNDNLQEEIIRLTTLRNQLEKGLLGIPHTKSNSTTHQRLPNTSNISFDFVDGENLLNALSKQLAVSNGSACNSASVSPSHVLRAMGVAPSLAHASLRFSLGRNTTEKDVVKAIAFVTEVVAKQREENILWERRGSK